MSQPPFSDRAGVPQEATFGLGAADMQQMTAWKLEAARAAVAEVPDTPSGTVLGLGSGSTAELMLQALAERVHAGLRVTGVPTSERTRSVAASLGIPLIALDDVDALDMSIDGADEVALPTLDLVKGRGGALLREKLIAWASHFRIIIVDASKLVPEIGAHYPIPVEVEPFGWRHTVRRLEALGARTTLRPAVVARAGEEMAASQFAPYITDGGHYVLDCAFGAVADPATLDAQIKNVRGVVEHGLFVGITERVYVAGREGIRRYDSVSGPAAEPESGR